MKVEEFIVESGWTKSEIAKRLGISKAAVSKWDEIPELQLKTLMILLGRTEKPDFVKDAKAMHEAGVPDLVADGKLAEYIEPEILPLELRKVLRRDWKLRGDKVHWQGKWWGRGSKYDFQYSASRLREWGKALKVLNNQQVLSNLQARRDYVSSLIPGFDCTPEQNGQQMLEVLADVRSGKICPVIVDLVENRYEHGNPSPLRVNPWERLPMDEVIQRFES